MVTLVLSACISHVAGVRVCRFGCFRSSGINRIIHPIDPLAVFFFLFCVVSLRPACGALVSALVLALAAAAASLDTSEVANLFEKDSFSPAAEHILPAPILR